jgi:nicotinamide riboside kinase/CYTH domain-containing protein
MLELERAYMFPAEDIDQVFKMLGVTSQKKGSIIVDNYLNPQLRIRSIDGKTFLTRKGGDKGSGVRTEEEGMIDAATSRSLISESKLCVSKTRYTIDTISHGVKITLDMVTSPMNIVILEIESTEGIKPPTAKELFGQELLECPLSAWNFFRRKIGICGAASSGKTETAKLLSHLLNTNLQANSFCVTEYATSFIQKYDINPSAMDQFILWHSQKLRENSAASKADIVVSDCPTFLSYIYMLLHNRNKMDKQFRIHLVKLYKRVLEDLDSYDNIIYLRPHNRVDNNIRFQSNDQIRDMANRIHSFLKWHSIPHTVADRKDANKIVNNLFYLNRA